MTKEDLIHELKTSRAELEALLQDIPDKEISTPGYSGEWSVKDLLAHLAAWEAELVTALAKLKQGIRSAYFGESDAAVDAKNAKIYAENKDRTLERVMADFKGVRRQVIRQVEQFSQAELDTPVTKKTGTPLMDYVVGETMKHQQDHLPDLRSWRGRTLS